ncbi:ABC transporter ATP-binding protein [Inquilinus limosus]|uniref:ABC transporter ATP-binding protein n=1 Tax=Inquilinus limosus TaxID=171674 RepID=UPI000402EB6F|nr:ABC transporter ATP-binding protein [Inquilinus limosus]
MIEVRDLGIRFAADAPPAVDGVSFAVAAGETFGLVGESGCGKSTVLRAIAGLITGYAGEVRLGGAALPPERPRSFFKRVQMVFQDPYGSLHPRQTIQAQLLEPLRNQGLTRPAAAVGAALDAVGLPRAAAFRFPHQLSGGQRQRVAIARALMLEPEVLLLDEPTSALDVSVQAEILNLLMDLRAQRGLTYILVSHDLAVVAHMCHRIAVMQGGRIVDGFDAATLRAGQPEHPYTRELLAASEAYGGA